MNDFSKTLSLLLAVGVAACASSGTMSEPADTGPVAAQPPAAETPPATTTAAAGALHFTDAQADNGRDTFRAICTECHYSSEFSDAQFKFKWSRRSAGDLYEQIYLQMPESAPGSLSPDEAVSLVSYIMRLNGFEAGDTELAPDADALDAISLRSIRN